MQYVIQLIGTAGACACFALLFRAPKRSVIPGMLAGVATYAAYLAATKIGLSPVAANFAGAAVAAVASELLARRLRMPATIFASVAVIPLVPGGGMYRTMLLISEADYEGAAATGVETILIAGAIAVALALAASLARRLRFRA